MSKVTIYLNQLGTRKQLMFASVKAGFAGIDHLDGIVWSTKDRQPTNYQHTLEVEFEDLYTALRELAEEKGQ